MTLLTLSWIPILFLVQTNPTWTSRGFTTPRQHATHPGIHRSHPRRRDPLPWGVPARNRTTYPMQPQTLVNPKASHQRSATCRLSSEHDARVFHPPDQRTLLVVELVPPSPPPARPRFPHRRCTRRQFAPPSVPGRCYPFLSRATTPFTNGPRWYQHSCETVFFFLRANHSVTRGSRVMGIKRTRNNQTADTAQPDSPDQAGTLTG